ncbi:MAG: HYR domain-containing protein [bacterium]
MELGFEASLLGKNDPGTGKRESNIPVLAYKLKIPVGELSDTLQNDPNVITRFIEAGSTLMFVGYAPEEDIEWSNLSLGMVDGVEFSLLSMSPITLVQVGLSDVSLLSILEMLEQHHDYVVPILDGVIQGGITGSINPLRTAVENAINGLGDHASQVFVKLLNSITLACAAGFGANAELGAEGVLKLGGGAKLESSTKGSLLLLLLNSAYYSEENNTILSKTAFPVNVDLTVGASIGEGVELEIGGGGTVTQNLFELTFTHWDNPLPAPSGMTVAGFEVLEFNGVVNEDESFSGTGFLVLPMGGMVEAYFEVDANGSVITGTWWGGFDLGPLGRITLAQGALTNSGIEGIVNLGFLYASYTLTSSGMVYGFITGNLNIAGQQLLSYYFNLESNGFFTGNGNTQLGGLATELDLSLTEQGFTGSGTVNILGSTLQATDIFISPQGAISGTFTGELIAAGHTLSEVSLEIVDGGLGLVGTARMDLFGISGAELNLTIRNGVVKATYQSQFVLFGTSISHVTLTLTRDNIMVDAYIADDQLIAFAGQVTDSIYQSAKAAQADLAAANQALSLAKSELAKAQTELNNINTAIADLDSWYYGLAWWEQIGAWAGYQTARAALVVSRDIASAAVWVAQQAVQAAQEVLNQIIIPLKKAIDDLKLQQNAQKAIRDAAAQAYNEAKTAMLYPDTDPRIIALIGLQEAARAGLHIALEALHFLEQSLGTVAQIASYVDQYGLNYLFKINSAHFQSNLDSLGPGSYVQLTADIVFMGEADQVTFNFSFSDPFGSFQAMSATLRPEHPDPSVDSAPPETTGNAPDGWQNSSVSLELKAIDNVGGSGVASITYSASGAQTISSTTVSGDTATLLIHNEGITNVSFFATDAAGNSELPQVVSVYIDLTPPGLATNIPVDHRVDPGETIRITAADHDGGSGVSFITYRASGAEIIPEQTVLDSTATLSLTVTGETTLTITATDKSGNCATMIQDVIVADIEPPVVTAPADIIAFEATGLLSAVEIGQATATDNVGVVSITSNAPGSFPVGDTIVTWTAFDAAGNSASAEQLVSVVDTTPPELTVPADIEYFEATGPLTVVPIGKASAHDLVGVVSLVNDAPATFPVGTTVVQWTASDAAGNSTFGLQLVTVVDTTPPAITLSIDPGEGPYYTADTIAVNITVQDLVDADPTVTLTHSSTGSPETAINPGNLDLFMHAGQNMITLTATDMYGNTATQKIEFEVILKLTEGRVTVKPESLKVNPGEFTVSAVFPAPYEATAIEYAVADGALSQKINFDPDTDKAIIKFNRMDITDPYLPVDTCFSVTGEFWYNGVLCQFEGSDTIMKVEESPANNGKGPEQEARGKNR